MDKLLSLKMDFVFNRLFSKKGNESILKDFLESILDIKIEKIEIIPEARLERTSRNNKYGVLDLKATLNDGIVVDIEMQVNDNKDIEKRTIFYAGKLMSEQLELGEKYYQIKDIIMINILDYEFIDLPEYHTEAITVARKHREYEMVQSLRYHFIELPKFRRAHPDLNNKLEQWLAFIDGINKEMVEMAIKKNKEIKKASEELEYLSGDAELRRLEFLKFKAACDAASREGYLVEVASKEAREKGMKEGIEEGMQKGMQEGIEKGVKKGEKNKTIEIAKEMIKLKMPIETIIKVTKLTEKELNKIKDNK